ncbi:di-trans,poly-cis-decaprenylcistransferase [Alteromonadaceae bacterium M269]|nr:di-trans,poly-cis-decaprenylcistransferase [Alteromonadaceae bacterium M269]
MTDISTKDKALPKHVAIIMDGNGRWAKNKGKIRTFGHKAGVESVRSAVQFAATKGIHALTLFAFSSENWNRPKDEVSVLLELFNFVLNNEVKKLHKNNIKLKVVGDISRFDDKLKAKIARAEKLTENNDALVLNIAANYGGRWDITHAAKLMAQKAMSGELDIENVGEKEFDEFTAFAGLPELDLLIRTGGDSRVSNFMLWQCAYAELYFTDTLWPDFDSTEFDKALDDFASRQRRFGLTGEQVDVA